MKRQPKREMNRTPAAVDVSPGPNPLHDPLPRVTSALDIIRASGLDPDHLLVTAAIRLQGLLDSEAPDVVLRALDLTFKLLGAYSAKAQGAPTQVIVPVQVNVPGWAQPPKSIESRSSET
jgi:hypothetical protein